MPFLRLRDARTGTAVEFSVSEVRLGRDPELEFPIAGDAGKVVSGAHARLVHDGRDWWVEDLGSRNGTYVNDRRLSPGAREIAAPGTVIGLGESGPRIKVEAAAKRQLETTLTETPLPVRPSAPTLRMAGMEGPPPAASAKPPPPRPPPPPPPSPPSTPQALRILLREVRTGEQFEASGGRIRIGRGQECEVRPVGPSDTAVSRVHTEIVLKPNGTVVVRDARSRNGTFVNGKPLGTEHEMKLGDHIRLGPSGPEVIVEQFSGPGVPAAADAPPARLAAVGEPKTKEGRRRSFGGKGATVFFKEMIDETSKRSAARVRVIVWSFVVLVAGVAGALYWWSERRVRETAAAALVAQHAFADSLRVSASSEYNRLRVELESARSSSAPAAVVESLRNALNDAQQRTTALEAALRRAQTAMQQQLAAGDSARRAAQGDVNRLRSELAQANTSQVPRDLLDSLRRAVQAAEDRASGIETQMRAVRGVNLAAVAQANQAAVGLVSVFVGGEVFDGSGFVIARSGYFVTNRHVVMPGNRAPDSVFVTMADQRYMSRSSVVGVPGADGPDVALLRIANYGGPHIPNVDWSGTKARQGEPAALIGFPAGVAAAYDRRTETVRTSMSAGIFSKVTSDLVQFDGFTVGGSSGSPIFNANGEVVAVHRAGLREATGLSFAVPVKEVLSLLPADVKGELGLR